MRAADVATDRSAADERLTLRGSYAGLRIIGALLVAISVFVALPGTIGGLTGENAAIAAGLALLGLSALTFGRRVIIDRAAGEVQVWWGFGLPWRWRRYALRRFDTVVLAFDGREDPLEERRADVMAAVALDGPDGRVVLRRCLEADGARDIGHQVARFLDLPLIDQTGT